MIIIIRFEVFQRKRKYFSTSNLSGTFSQSSRKNYRHFSTTATDNLSFIKEDSPQEMSYAICLMFLEHH